MDQHKAKFRTIVGEAHVLDDATAFENYGRDWTKTVEPNPSVIVLPRTTDEVAQLLRYCNEHGLAVVPSGGRTGLAGAAVAANGEVVISLMRMTTIGEIDRVGLTVEVEAGVTTQALQEAAADAGLFFPLDLAAKGSCQLGGNVATNAGGVKLIRYGGTREQVLGIEVVLADGRVLNMNTTLRKNNTGYDLKQLFIGSEGTLGIITKVTFKLMAQPGELVCALMAAATFDAVPKILSMCHQQGAQVTAFEFFTKRANEIVLQHIPGAKLPFAEQPEYFVLLELERRSGESDAMEPLLEKIFEAGLIEDATIAQSSAQAGELWGLRENITEALAAHGHVRKNDVSLGIHQLGDFVASLEKIMGGGPDDIDIVVFGHIGDGNLHINYLGDKSTSFDDFNRDARQIEERVFAELHKVAGSISAEHGVGLLKKGDLHYSRSADEIDFMRQIKAAFDPNSIMNPGKIF